MTSDLQGIRAQTLANAKMLLRPTAALSGPSTGSQATLLPGGSTFHESMDVVVFRVPIEPSTDYTAAIMVGLTPAIEGDKAPSPEGAIRKLFLTTCELLKTYIPKVLPHQRSVQGGAGGVYDADMVNPMLVEAPKK